MYKLYEVGRFKWGDSFKYILDYIFEHCDDTELKEYLFSKGFISNKGD